MFKKMREIEQNKMNKNKQKDGGWKKVVERMGKVYSLIQTSMDFSSTPWVYFLSNPLLQVNMFSFFSFTSIVMLPEIHSTITNR